MHSSLLKSDSLEMKQENPTRAKLIDSAEKLFWFKGHKSTSIDDIAAASGQSKGAFFHYFKSKKEITILAVHKYAQEEIFDGLEKHFSTYNSTKEALLSWAHELYTNNEMRGAKGGCLLGNLGIDMADQDEDMRIEISKLFLEWENRLVAYFKEPNRTGTILMEPRQFARSVIGAYQGMMMSIKIHKDKRRTAREFQMLAELFERLIKD